jgi:hypothetical protein
MHHSETRTWLRAKLPRALVVTAAFALLFALVPGVASASTPRVWQVSPSNVPNATPIQTAVNNARSGDVIKLAPGTYKEAVCIVGKGLTIVGAGRARTTIAWPDWTRPDVKNPNGTVTTGDQPDAPVGGNACWQEWASHDPESVAVGTLQHQLADDVSGLFFLNPNGPVTVTGLSTINHTANGIVVEGGKRGVIVSQTKGTAHDRYGVLASNSSNIVIRDNVETAKQRVPSSNTSGNSGTAGVSVSDSANANALVQGNRTNGWNIGVFVREARTGAVVGNDITNSCVGINLFDDTNTEVPPNQASTINAGNFAVLSNYVHDNHRFCLAGIGQVAARLKVSGTGISVVNMDSVLLKGNTVKNNGPADPLQPLDFPAAGVLLLSLPAFNTTTPNAAIPVEKVAVVGNTITGNTTAVDSDGPGPNPTVRAPLDIEVGFPPGTVLADPTNPNNPPIPIPPVGSGIVFQGNTCGYQLVGLGAGNVKIDCGVPPAH